MGGGESERFWEEELLQDGQRRRWTLESDRRLLELVAGATRRLTAEIERVVGVLSTLETKLTETESAVTGVGFRLRALAESQFVEFKLAPRSDPAAVRLSTVPSSATTMSAASTSKGDRSRDEEEEDDEDETMRRAVDALSTIDPLNERPLPHLIGSEAFAKDPAIGLGVRARYSSLAEEESPSRPPPSRSQGRARNSELTVESAPPVPVDDSLFDHHQSAAFSSSLFKNLDDSSLGPIVAAVQQPALTAPPPPSVTAQIAPQIVVVGATVKTVPPVTSVVDDDLFGEQAFGTAAAPPPSVSQPNMSMPPAPPPPPRTRRLFDDKDDDDDDGLADGRLRWA